MADPNGVDEGVLTRWFCHVQGTSQGERVTACGRITIYQFQVGVREEGRSPEDKSNVADFATSPRRGGELGPGRTAVRSAPLTLAFYYYS